MTVSGRGIAFDRAGAGDRPVLLLHAGVADRRMWQPQWAALTAEREVCRPDLRGYGESDRAPAGGRLDHPADLLGLLDELGIEDVDVVGASYGAGVAVELALRAPERVASLLLAPPGGSLLSELTPDLEDFLAAEREALRAGDLDAAVEADLRWWLAGPGRELADLDPGVVERVRGMRRRAFEIELSWSDVRESPPDPPTVMRLAEVDAATLVLLGRLDLETTHHAARRVVRRVPGARAVDWPDVAHLPSMERPAEFTGLLLDWLRAPR